MRISINPEHLAIILKLLENDDVLRPDSYEWGRVQDTYFYLRDKLEGSGYEA